jgi:hypothetical protein
MRVVSGGQTGVDRAALDAAIAVGVEYGGWCPLGGWAEDLPLPPGLLSVYPALREAPSADPAVRTRLNVRDSSATLVIRRPGVDSPGTDLTVAVAAQLSRPVLVTTGDDGEVLAWLDEVRPAVLNVAGPRESQDPGVYAVARALLDRVVRSSVRPGAPSTSRGESPGP